MSDSRTQARMLSYVRRAWKEYLRENGEGITWQRAEGFLTSSHDAAATVENEIRANLPAWVTGTIYVHGHGARECWHGELFHFLGGWWRMAARPATAQ